MRKSKAILTLLAVLILLLALSPTLYSATTGKIAGKIVDKETGYALPGANILVIGTQYGAAADLEGEFFIINLPPGNYSVQAQMMGYATQKIENVRVSVNSTTNLTYELKTEVIEGEVVVVSADKISIKKDQTSAVRNVSSDQIEVLPLENLQDVINMQAGVVDGHFRGGRSNEVSYLIDGLQVDESFSGTGRSVSIENEVIEDLEIITGTFNAEYGKAMSGIVNAITKDGGNEFHGSVTGYMGNYYTGHDEFIGLKASDVLRNQDYKAQLHGPIIKDLLTFFVNVRHQNNQNHLNAVRRFEVTDYSDYTGGEETWMDVHNGDSSYVPLNDNKSLSIFSKLTFKPDPNLKLTLTYSNNTSEWGNYSHMFKYNPDGKARSHQDNTMTSLQVNHNIGMTAFHELKLSYIDYYYGNYLYENPLDSRYIHDQYFKSQGPGFYTGGQQKNHTERINKDLNVKYDLTWQVHKNHNLKGGFLYTAHDLDNASYSIRNKYYADPNVYENYYDAEMNTFIYPNYQAMLLGDSTRYGEEYMVKPYEFSAYLQDKMEFQEMVINLGVRYDLFDPNTSYPSNWRNPANQLTFEDETKMSTMIKAEPQVQISPRFGLSYQLSDAALLHFSYGHFFQAPPMYAFYQNHSLLVTPTDYETQTGNPTLRAQQTVQYEVGLWQEIIEGMGIEVNLFYRDIYDLLSMRIVSTYNQIQYGLYTNKDYGNVKGLEVKYDVAYGPITAFVNYTLQYTRGNADNPTMTFTRAGDSADPIARLIPMSWDQRHTLNGTVTYAHKNAGLTLSGFFDSGTPYTWVPIAESRLAKVNLYPNNSIKPSMFRTDLFGYYDLKLSNQNKLRFSVLVENLSDRKNELGVNPQTGHANEAIIREIDLSQHKSLFNDIHDRIINPGAISAPRYIKFGIGYMF